MVVGGSLSRKQALKRVTAKQYDLAQQPVIDPRFTGDTDFFGIPACSGIVTGKVVKSDEKTLANSRIKLAPRMGKGLATEIVQALSEQAVVVPGTQATTIVMARLAQQLASLRKQRDEIAAEVERLSACSPSLAGPGLHARSRAQDRSTTPDRSGPQSLCLGHPSVRVCGSCASDPALRLLDSRRASL